MDLCLCDAVFVEKVVLCWLCVIQGLCVWCRDYVWCRLLVVLLEYSHSKSYQWGIPRVLQHSQRYRLQPTHCLSIASYSHSVTSDV
jgi:hypothetical protein